MSNSKLVNYTKLSPNCTKPRNHKIDRITIHHMASNLTVQQCGNVFASSSRKASANYGISTDGKVGMYVEEANRSWATSNAANDHRAVTIEVANSKVGGNWPVSDVAIAKLIDLCADICKRNGIAKLNYTGDKTGNLTMHRWYASTLCPGPYLASKFPYIASEVNKRLISISTKITTTYSIVNALADRGIISNKELWMTKAAYNTNGYWLAYKIANNTINKKGADLESVNDIVWELNHRGIITNSDLWVALLANDTDLYWLARKSCSMTQNK